MTIYINEAASEEFYKTMMFEYEKEGKIINIHLMSNQENILKDPDFIIRDDFKKIRKNIT